MFCANVLAHKGIGSQIVHTARQGLDAIGAFRPDLVLLDLYLPDMNGIEVAQLIRERPDMALTPIVFMSGEEDIDKRFDAIRMGGDDFLAKPMKPRHLLASVTSRMGRARKIAAAGIAGEGVADARSGRIDRATLVHDIERARRGELGECVGLIMLSVDDVPALAKRLGFVRTGDLAQQIGTTIASEPALKSGVCALGDFSFLSLLPVSSEGALRIAAENLRARLSGRGWLSADASVRISFSLGGARADEPGIGVDDLLAGVSDAVHAAHEQGGGRSEWAARSRDEAQVTPDVRLAHAILRRPLIADTTEFRFRALVPLRGQLTSQFLADFALVAPRASQALRIERDTFLPIAKSLNVMRAVDRWQVHALGQRARRESAAMPELRLLVPMSVETLFDPAFPQWLGADLHGLQCDADALAGLRCDAAGRRRVACEPRPGSDPDERGAPVPFRLHRCRSRPAASVSSAEHLREPDRLVDAVEGLARIAHASGGGVAEAWQAGRDAGHRRPLAVGRVVSRRRALCRGGRARYVGADTDRVGDAPVGLIRTCRSLLSG